MADNSEGKRGRRTNSDGLDLDTILNVGRVGVVALLVSEDTLIAEGVDEGSSACRTRVS